MIDFPMIPYAAQGRNDRVRVSRKLRDIFFNIITDMKPICPVCKTIITVDDYEISHIVSVRNNGDNKYSNLTATHKRCNSYIGTDTICFDDLSEYEKSRVLMIRECED